MVCIPGPRLDPATRRALADMRVAGVILFRRNVEDPAQLRRLCAHLHRLRAGMLVAVDHAGGRVNRLPPPFTAFPPARAIGRLDSERLAFATGHAIGDELAGVGIDIDFAPVLDVLTHPRNRVIGDRAYGSAPEVVARLGLAFARGLLAAGVIPCGKHFPGHGGTRGDSHVVLPRVTRTRRDLWRVDLVPFRRAAAAGLPCIMTAHVLYPHLDPRAPASLSVPILTGLLRRGLGFRGLVVSDDLQMGAVADRVSPEEAAVRAVAAGNDLLLVCGDLGFAARARRGLAVALASGRLPASRVHEAARRIEHLRRRRRRVAAPIRRWPIPAHATLVRALA